jgi:hypothetical protein
MASAPSSPKDLLKALLAGATVLPFPEDALAQARALAQAPQTADAAKVETLPEPLAQAVLEASVRAKAPALAEALASSGTKSLAKAAKKALYQLKSSGVAVSEAKAEVPGAGAGQTAAESEEIPPSILSALTGNGERAMILARPVAGGLETAHLVLSDTHGVVHLAIHEASRRLYRKQLREIRSGCTPSAVEIPLEEAKARLAAAAALNAPAKMDFPQGLDALMRHLGITPAARALPEAPASGEDAALVENSGALHDEPEIAEWLPDAEALKVLAEKWQEIGANPVALETDGKKKEALEAAFREVARAHFTPEIRALYAARLKEMSDFYARSGRETPARLAAASARALGTDGALPPFAEGLFLKVIPLAGKELAQMPGMGVVPGGLSAPPASLRLRAPGEITDAEGSAGE